MSAVKIEEYQVIHDTVQHYLDGGRTGKGDLMKPAFHADATIYGYVGKDLFAGPIQGLFDWNDRNGAAKDVVVNVTILQVVETVAVVRVEADNWTGQRYTDFLTLLKVDGRWKIMQKVFHHHAA
ncbi:nuclear transport factor 2 family protein [Roseomonas rosulenta]|uniref:nuclear transport factor 2 family protein n=1 Tax=Roseomonas rosulenta TaxID=2748667 RepID=UPI0018DF56EA|nr:nuclear transport factor 2 family protein [Roseomonas rosulenta]